MRSAAVSLCFVCVSVAGAAEESIKSVDPNDGWKPHGKSNNVAIYARIRAGTSLKEFRAVGEIDASSRAVHSVIDDIENYSRFMPYTAECRLIKREENALITYQRLSPKIASDRDYTLRITTKSWPSNGGVAFLNEWTPANELGPPQKKGVVRVDRCEGAWLLEPISPNKTRATYSVFSDTGGAIPGWLANYASETGIGKLFAAVRKQVTDPKYGATKK
jgi:hypothetical protein